MKAYGEWLTKELADAIKKRKGLKPLVLGREEGGAIRVLALYERQIAFSIDFEVSGLQVFASLNTGFLTKTLRQTGAAYNWSLMDSAAVNNEVSRIFHAIEQALDQIEEAIKIQAKDSKESKAA